MKKNNIQDHVKEKYYERLNSAVAMSYKFYTNLFHPNNFLSENFVRDIIANLPEYYNKLNILITAKKVENYADSYCQAPISLLAKIAEKKRTKQWNINIKLSHLMLPINLLIALQKMGCNSMKFSRNISEAVAAIAKLVKYNWCEKDISIKTSDIVFLMQSQLKARDFCNNYLRICLQAIAQIAKKGKLADPLAWRDMQNLFNCIVKNKKTPAYILVQYLSPFATLANCGRLVGPLSWDVLQKMIVRVDKSTADFYSFKQSIQIVGDIADLLFLDTCQQQKVLLNDEIINKISAHMQQVAFAVKNNKNLLVEYDYYLFSFINACKLIFKLYPCHFTEDLQRKCRRIEKNIEIQFQTNKTENLITNSQQGIFNKTINPTVSIPRQHNPMQFHNRNILILFAIFLGYSLAGKGSLNGFLKLFTLVVIVLFIYKNRLYSEQKQIAPRYIIKKDNEADGNNKNNFNCTLC